MRVVVKVGTSTLTYGTGRLNFRHVESLCKIMSDLANAGNEMLLVSSGAIAVGAGKLKMEKRPKDMSTKQACASVGMCELMYVYDKLFSEYDHTVSQVLLTADDVDNPIRRKNIENTFERLLELGAIPVINENDTVATEEINSVGDNDTLAAIVAKCVHADLLILMSDIDGLFTANPHENPDAELIPVVDEINDEIRAIAGGKGSEFATGGMETKIKAAEIANNAGTDMIIANSKNLNVLYDIMDGKQIGTLFRHKN